MTTRNRFFMFLCVLFVLAAVYYWFSTDHTADMVLIGTVDANQVEVSAQVGGRIDKLLVEDGANVKQGDLIAVLDSRELTAQKDALEAAVAQFRSSVSGTQSTYEATRGGTASQVANAQAQLSAARANLQEAQAQLTRDTLDDQRFQGLFRQGIASKQQSDQSAQQVKAGQARVAAAQDQVRAAAAGVRSAQAQTHQTGAAESQVAATRAQEQNARAQLQQALTRLGYTQVTAPVTGTVSVRVARQGEVVNAGEPIVTIVDYTDTWVQASLPETDAADIAIGDALRVRLPWGEVVGGKVIYKSPEADFATQRDVSNRKRDIRTIVLKVRVENAKRDIVPGMTAEVLVPKSKVKGS